MTSLPGVKKNNMAAKYILLEFKFSFINKRWTFTSANKQSSWKSILQKSQEKVSFSILICNIGQFTQLLNFWLSFRSFLLWKRIIITQGWYSEKISRKKNNENLPIYGEKCTLKTNENIQNVLITWLMTSSLSFGHEKNYQVEHYFPANFLCRVMKRQLFTALRLVSQLFRSCSLPP